MNFFEAYLEAKNGKKIAIDGVSTWWAQLDNDKESNCATLNTYSARGKCSDIIDNMIIAHWLGCEWQIYEDPKESKGLWKPSDDESNCHSLYISYHPYRNVINFKDYDIRHTWGRALETFMRLKGNPFAVPVIEDKSQYCISPYHRGSFEFVIAIDCLTRSVYKCGSLSPCFEKEIDAKQAIKDIGADNLLHMFKTFQGIYE